MYYISLMVGLFGSEDVIQRMRISLTRWWLGIANFSVWLEKINVVGDSQCYVCFVGCGWG
jgi:hypothetical protein